MHTRYAVGATLGALALLVTMPASAHATAANPAGTFSYEYKEGGKKQHIEERDLRSLKCVEYIGEDPDEPIQAFSPENATDTPVIVYADRNCAGKQTTLPAHSEARPKLNFKSYYFKKAPK